MTPQADPTQPPTPPRKRRRWPWVVLGIVVLLFILIALLPTIAGTSPVRGIIVGKINDNINGSAEIADISLSWFGSTSIEGIKVYSPDKRLILDVPKIKLGISLLDVLRQNFSLGDDNEIDIASFVLDVDAKGQTNFQKLLKAPPAEVKPPHEESAEKPEKQKSPEPTKVPNISGKFVINFQGTVEGAGPPVNVRQSSANLTITDINQPISESLQLVYQVGDSAASTIQTSGTLDAIENNTLQIDKLAGAQKIILSSVDLSAANPFLKSLGPDAKLAGAANGSLDITAAGITGISAIGQIDVKNASFAGGPLVDGDQLKLASISIPISITRTTGANGTDIKIEKLGVQTPVANVAVTGQVTQESLLNIANHQAPGSEGNVAINADVSGVADIFNQLSHTLKLQQGVQITGGAANEDLTFAIHPQNVVLSQKLNASIKGTRNGQPFEPQPIAFSAESVLVPHGEPLPIVKDIKIAWTSSFASVQGGGSLEKLGINGNFDLSKLRTELAQFIDLGNLQLQGTGNFVVTTNGDVSAADAPITAKATLNLQNVKVSGVASQETTQENLALVANADLLRKENSVVGIDNANLTITGGDPSAPLIDVAANGNADFTANTASFTLSKCAVDLKKLQDQYGALIPALADQKISIDSGNLSATANATSDGKMYNHSLSATLSALAISKDGRRILNHETIRASLNADLDTSSKTITVKASLDSSLATASLDNAKIVLSDDPWDTLQSGDVSAAVPDLSKLSMLANAFSSPTTQPSKKSRKAAPTTEPSPIQITSGSASLKLNLSRDVAKNTTNINLTDCKVSNLAIARDNRQYQFDPANPITATLVAAIQTGSGIESINVSSLSADLGIAKVSMPQPIVATNLAATPDIQGSIKIEGSLAGARGIGPLLDVVQGGTFPYTGDFVVVQALKKQPNGFSLDGSATASKFQVMQNGKSVFSEDQVNLTDKVDVDPGAKNAIVQSLTVDMTQSKALGVKFSGQLSDWDDARTIKGLNSDKAELVLTYDLEKLWAIARPMLSPDLQTQYKDLKVRGKFTKTFTVWGAYPSQDSAATTQPSIATLNADGSLAVDYLDLPQGLTIENFELPFRMNNGVLKTVASTAGNRQVQLPPPPPGRAPTTAPTATTALCNGGALNLDGIVLDMRSPDPLLSVKAKHWLLQYVQLNPVLADSIGHDNLLFKDANEASGYFDLQIVKCKNVPLGDLITKKPDAEAAIVFNMTDLQLDGPVPQVMSSVLNLGGQGIHGNIRSGQLTLSKGTAQSDFSLLLTQTGVQKTTGQTVTKDLPMRFTGGVILATSVLKDFQVNIPSELIPNQIGGQDVRTLLPNGLVVPFTGTTDHFKFDFQKALTKSLGNSLIGGNGQNPLDNLNNLLGGNKKKKQSNDQ